MGSNLAVWTARILAGAYAVLFLYLGLGTMFAPAGIMAEFGLEATGIGGTSAVRADFGAFFIGTAIMGLAGLVRDPRWLLGAAMMVGLAFVGRAIGTTMESTPDPFAAGVGQSMVVEAIGFAIFVLGWFILRRRAGTHP